MIISSIKNGSCQYNFIISALAKTQNLNVIKMVSVTFNGFNIFNRYGMQLTEAYIRFGDKDYI